MSSVLRRKVLILNKDWVAIGTCTVRRAITLVSNYDTDGTPRAKIIGEDLGVYEWQEWLEIDPGELFVRSPSRAVKIPSAIICRSKTLPRAHASFTRAAVFVRDQGVCQYCEYQIPKKELTIDHIIPLSRGGKHNWLNCVTCCKWCNNYKGDRTPEEARMSLIRQPNKPPPVLIEEPVPELWKKLLPR